MTDVKVVVSSVHQQLLDLAKQASVLGIGLQNAAPGERLGVEPNQSVQYLIAISDYLMKMAEQCEKLNRPGG